MNLRFAAAPYVMVLILQSGAAFNAIAADVVVGKFGNVEVKTGAIRKTLDGVNPQARAQVESSQENLERFVRSELLREKLAADARAKGWDQRPEVLAAIDEAKKQILVSAYLNSFARPEAGYPGDDEIRSFYAANEGQFFVPKQYHLAQIFLAAPVDADAAATDAVKTKAEALTAQALGGADFAALAKANSDEKTSAGKGGDVGWVLDNRLLPDIQRALNKLQINGVSAPVKTGGGFHILKLLDIKPAGMRPLAEVRNVIVAELRAAKARANEAQYEGELMRKTPPVIDQDALAALWKSMH